MPEYSKENFKAECDRRRENNLIVKGKTFDIKDDIKNMGGIWDSRQKQWLLPDAESVAKCHEMMGLGDGPPPQMQADAEPNEPLDPGSVPF